MEYGTAPQGDGRVLAVAASERRVRLVCCGLALPIVAVSFGLIGLPTAFVFVVRLGTRQ